MDDFTFVLYPITFPITMRDDVRAPCTSMCEGKAIQMPLLGKRKSHFKNSCPIVRGAWAKEGQKPLGAALCTMHRDQLCRPSRGTRMVAVGMFAVLVFPSASWGQEGLGETFFSMQSCPGVGLQ